MGDKKEKKRKYNEDEEVEKVEKKAKKKSKESEPVVEEKKKKKSKTDENEEEKPKKTKKSKEIEAPVVEEQKKPKKKKAEREENSCERPGTTVEGTLLCNFTMSEEQSNPGSKREDKTAPSTANHRKDTYELWKNGEEAWKNNSLDPTYLATNPDKITRIFCGNLNKNITEEQLHEAFPGISYIKWICDKTTGEFYGTTFLEMSDAKSAANAVMKDRTKLLGRLVSG